VAKGASSGTTSLISRQVVVEGEISGEENLHVDGRINGSIRLTGDLFIGASGVVEAEVEARNVVVQGAVTGKVVARQQLEVQPSGRFSGECTAASIQIHEGAVFEGLSRMTANSRRLAKPQPADDPVPKSPIQPSERVVPAAPTTKPN
jgi:cytoskeletal protein CcmA (bactofilin family)